MASSSQSGGLSGDDRTVGVGPPGERRETSETSVELDAGACIGRYRVEAKLGVGGMGAVYRAHDPELRRAVALKLLRLEGAATGASVPSAGDRLMVEARVLANLEHPNIVQVFDAGSIEGRLFIAMELVDGWTLSTWIRETEPKPAAVLSTCIAAGRGLAEAHRSQVVHRDFKPSNVLVGRDGRVKVVDFGLARLAGQTAPIESSGRRDASWGSSDASLTQTGTVMGTPLYMAPEQHEGKQVDALADQFGFCATTWAALYGEPPFSGNMNLLFAAKMAGRLAETPPGVSVARQVHAALVRGLAPDPEARWPSMSALLDALGRDYAAGRRRMKRLALGAGLVASVGFGMWGSASADSRCTNSAPLAAEVWNPGVAARIEAAFEASGSPYAADTWRRVETSVDAHVSDWIVRRDEACRAGVEGDGPREDLLDLSMQCYGRRLDEVRALLGVLAVADAEVVERSPGAAATLQSLDGCDDASQLGRHAPPPSDPTIARAAEGLRRRLSDAVAMARAGRLPDATTEAQTVLVAARELRDPPLLAEALLVAGMCLHEAGQSRDARPLLEEAFFVAEQLGASDLITRAASRLVIVVGVDLAEHDTGRLWERHASAAVDRYGGDPALQASLFDRLGLLARSEGKYDEALACHQRALEMRERSVGRDDYSLVKTLTNIGATLAFLDRNPEALAIAERTLALTVEAEGPDHPDTAKAHNNLGGIHSRLGDADSAERHFVAALEIRRRLFGEDHVQVATAMLNLSQLRNQQGRHLEAVEGIRAALPVLQRHLGAQHPHVAGTLYNLGLSEEALGWYDEALVDLRRSLTLRQEVLPSGHPDIAMSKFHVADVLVTTGKPEEALVLYEEALADLEASLGPEHIVLSDALMGRGSALVALGHAADAVPLLEGAAAIRHRVENDVGRVALAEFALARALEAAGQERGRAVALAVQAERSFAKAGPDYHAQRDEAARWLAARGAAIE